jgi:hypothetical protein
MKKLILGAVLLSSLNVFAESTTSQFALDTARCLPSGAADSKEQEELVNPELASEYCRVFQQGLIRQISQLQESGAQLNETDQRILAGLSALYAVPREFVMESLPQSRVGTHIIMREYVEMLQKPSSYRELTKFLQNNLPKSQHKK